MRVIAFNGSPRKEGNTYHAIRTVFEELEKEGLDTELIQLGSSNIRGCRACFKCFETKDNKCIQKDDLNDLIARMLPAEGIIIGSPTYFANVSTEVKALIDRAGLVSRANGNLFSRKVGASRPGQMRMRTLLPAPFAPRMIERGPAAISALTRSRIVRPPAAKPTSLSLRGSSALIRTSSARLP